MIIDFHSHILPGVDDGSPSLDISLAMLQAMARQGITHVVATPHFYPRYDHPRDFLERRNQAEALLRAAMCHQEGLPELLVGAEVGFFRGISQSDFLPELTIRGTHSILIEMPPAPWPEEFYRELQEIWTRWNIMPIIAHIDRYMGSFRTYGIPKRLAEMPVYVQANAEFFLERHSEKMAFRMLKADQIHLLGSDCHNLSDRKPNMGAALRKIRHQLGVEAMERIRGYGLEALGSDEEIKG